MNRLGRKVDQLWENATEMLVDGAGMLKDVVEHPFEGTVKHVRRVLNLETGGATVSHSEDDPYACDSDEYDPYGDDPYGDDPYGDDPYGDDPYGDDPYGDDPYGDDPYGDHSRGKQTEMLPDSGYSGSRPAGDPSRNHQPPQAEPRATQSHNSVRARNTDQRYTQEDPWTVRADSSLPHRSPYRYSSGGGRAYPGSTAPNASPDRDSTSLRHSAPQVHGPSFRQGYHRPKTTQSYRHTSPGPASSPLSTSSYYSPAPSTPTKGAGWVSPVPRENPYPGPSTGPLSRLSQPQAVPKVTTGSRGSGAQYVSGGGHPEKRGRELHPSYPYQQNDPYGGNDQGSYRSW